jgi:hypothetical protein
MWCAQRRLPCGATSYSVVIPAEAGIYLSTAPYRGTMGPGLPHGTRPWAEGPRGDDKLLNIDESFSVGL